MTIIRDLAVRVPLLYSNTWLLNLSPTERGNSNVTRALKVASLMPETVVSVKACAVASSGQKSHPF